MSKYQIRKNIIHQFVEEEAVLVSTSDAMITSLNSTAADIFRQLLDQPSSFEELLNYLLEAYDVSEETATKDLQTVLAEFMTNNLIESA